MHAPLGERYHRRYAVVMTSMPLESGQGRTAMWLPVIDMPEESGDGHTGADQRLAA
jgi:hypothetical protein